MIEFEVRLAAEHGWIVAAITMFVSRSTVCSAS